jgi:hypothetical protein
VSDEPQVFETDDGRFRIHGHKVAEVRKNGVALIAIACPHESCEALDFHIVMEEEGGSLHFVTHMSTTDDEAVTRSGLLFRAVSKLVFGNYDLKNIRPADDEERPESWKGTDIIPGMTPWLRD